ncbi:MAG: hypothetical protein HGB35_00120 [Geobacteraceae bacterium]|nr:hypothetical protein [Geobacteraceae bacterium]
MSIYNDAINHFGTDSQLLKCAEELNEMAAEIIGFVTRKMAGGDPHPHKIMCEKADVEITLKQVGIIFSNYSNICSKEKRFKLNRLAERINNENKG